MPLSAVSPPSSLVFWLSSINFYQVHYEWLIGQVVRIIIVNSIHIIHWVHLLAFSGWLSRFRAVPLKLLIVGYRVVDDWSGGTVISRSGNGIQETWRWSLPLCKTVCNASRQFKQAGHDFSAGASSPLALACCR